MRTDAAAERIAILHTMSLKAVKGGNEKKPKSDKESCEAGQKGFEKGKLKKAEKKLKQMQKRKLNRHMEGETRAG